MSQRNSVIKTPESTSLRRSPRLFQLNHSPKTPIPISNNISSRKPQIRSRNPAKSAIILKECSNGSEIHVDSAIGSRRKSNFGNEIVGIRRSSRLCNEVTSLVDVHKYSRSSRRLKKVCLARIDSLEMNDFVDSPVTPIVVGEKKCRYVNGECSNGETSRSIVLSLGHSERRVTRSCAKKMDGSVEMREVQKSGCKNSNLFDSRAGGGGRAIGRNVGCKGKEGGVKRSLVCALAKVRCGSLSPCTTPGIGRGSRRHSRKDIDGVKGKKSDLHECVDGNFERRITRSASKCVGKESDLCGQDRKRRDKIMSGRNELGNGDARKVIKKFRRTGREKRVKQTSFTSFSARLEGEDAALRDVGVKEKESQECGKKDGDKSKNSGSDIGHGTKVIGVKRKRKQAGLQGKDLGWTNEQETALQRAYFTAKPSPHFWKKVSKLVPGKSAQECFDKLHSVNPTPISNRHSSRLKKHNSPSEFLLKSDELLNSIPSKSKNHGKTKQRSQLARKNVRHLLRKYCQDSKPDLFSILEPSGNSLTGTPNLKAVQLTPTQSPVSPGFPSSGRHKKSLSRLSGLGRSPFTSPLVLKKVKNMALHDKYIDQLHVREGKRKAVSSRYIKSLQCQKNGTQNYGQKKDVLKAAKDALVSEARDVIEKFQQSQTNLMEAYSDSEEVLLSDNDEDDMGM